MVEHERDWSSDLLEKEPVILPPIERIEDIPAFTWHKLTPEFMAGLFHDQDSVAHTVFTEEFFPEELRGRKRTLTAIHVALETPVRRVEGAPEARNTLEDMFGQQFKYIGNLLMARVSQEEKETLVSMHPELIGGVALALTGPLLQLPHARLAHDIVHPPGLITELHGVPTYSPEQEENIAIEVMDALSAKLGPKEFVVMCLRYGLLSGHGESYALVHEQTGYKKLAIRTLEYVAKGKLLEDETVKERFRRVLSPA